MKPWTGTLYDRSRKQGISILARTGHSFSLDMLSYRGRMIGRSLDNGAFAFHENGKVDKAIGDCHKKLLCIHPLVAGVRRRLRMRDLPHIGTA
jgi:hypothetical protein